jgi:ethanolamine ammonia-lyase small subunit
VTDGFSALRRATPARVALGRSGDALPTGALLDLQDAHARARDAVHGALDRAALAAALGPALFVRSRAADRMTYLRRPDLGRRLDPACVLEPAPCDLLFVVADGLSAGAAVAHAPGVIAAARPLLAPLRIGPVVVAEQARVALGDAIGALVGAAMVAVLIGERPGLSVSRSLGIYLTAGPRDGRLDSERNCISNVHEAGLSHAEAAAQLAALVMGARRLGRTGVALKPDGATPALAAAGTPRLGG